MTTDGIILFAKQPGPTSFKALNTIKKALNTTKVGHTGTLDSFAQGLLVICTGRLTRLAGNITEFNKSYKAVIKFGQETDTLEYTGKTIKESPLPSLEALQKAIEAHTGAIMQQPPSFSAIHIDGQRASDLARKGKYTEIPARPVTIFSAHLLETKLSEDGLVEYALIDFSVSKGTYIRSLARDIANYCGSAGHLAGLYRTKVGNFEIEHSAGYSLLKDFSIENVITSMEIHKKELELKKAQPLIKGPKIKYEPDAEELFLQKEVQNKILPLTKGISSQCGFLDINLVSIEAEKDFENGKPLKSKNFNNSLYDLPVNSTIAVFSAEEQFKGLIEKDDNGRVKYKFVIN